MGELNKENRLKKELGLFDVYSISTGAMFSSGFFLLPGLAAAKAGPAVALAYLFAGFLILPAMFSKAELSTALPRAGGTYYFLDRSLGPMLGTIGGLGTYLSLALKTAFALIGIGAYASIFLNVPIKPLAVGLTVAFVCINIFGAKETASLQRMLVVTLLAVLSYFLFQGFYELTATQSAEVTQERFENFLPNGFEGLLSTIGFVFVSYAGLTKVASVAEEVKNPDRNIPLGMMLSLGSTTLIYVAGVYLMVALIPPETLHTDLTPVATTAEIFNTPFNSKTVVGFIVVAALAAFISTGNAGVMAASRYPMAMARDSLLPKKLANLGKHKTPTLAILLTGLLMIGFIVLLDAEGIAKLASAFQLMIFMLVNFAVIVMRESRISSYDPGYKSPLYPWMQLFGILVSFILIIYMGWMAILFTVGIVLLCLVWYYQYARKRVSRDGAIFHWFRRLGQKQYDELDHEFRGILKEKGLRQDDPFNEVVAKAHFLEVEEDDTFENIIAKASLILGDRLGVESEKLEKCFLDGTRTGATPVSQGAALPHMHLVGIDRPEMVLVRCKKGIQVEVFDVLGDEVAQKTHAIFILISPEENPAQHLRMLAELANKIDKNDFIDHWNESINAAHIKRLLLNDSRYILLTLSEADETYRMVNVAIRDLDLPDGCLIAMVQRGNQMIVPRGSTVLEPNDRVIIIGEPGRLETLKLNYSAA